MPPSRPIKAILIVVLALCGMAAAYAAESPSQSPPSEASLKELLKLTNVAGITKDISAEIDTSMQQGIEEALAGKQVSAEQRKILDEMRSRMLALIKETLRTQEIESLSIDIYRRSFNQREVDGMIAFYKTEAGRAVINKMPVVAQNTMQAVQGMLGTLMPKIQQLQADTLAKLEATEGK